MVTTLRKDVTILREFVVCIQTEFVSDSSFVGSTLRKSNSRTSCMRRPFSLPQTRFLWRSFRPLFSKWVVRFELVCKHMCF